VLIIEKRVVRGLWEVSESFIFVEAEYLDEFVMLLNTSCIVLKVIYMLYFVVCVTDLEFYL